MADISKIQTLDGTTYDIKDAKAFRPGTKLFSTNSFAPDELKSFYYSKIDNAFYASDKRFTTTFTVDSTQYNTSNLFDGSYEGGLNIPDGKSGVITIDYSGQPGSKFPGYPYGFIYLSFYAGRLPKTITGRVYNNYASQGVGWKDLLFQKLDSNGYIWYAQQSYYGLQTLEITIIANDSSTYQETRPVELEFYATRPDPAITPVVSKYRAETLYYPLTAPSFIGSLTGNASTATTLQTSRTIQTNLESTSSAAFNGSANITPGVTGTLPVGNGGTGQTTAQNAANAFMNALSTGSNNPVDADYYISQYAGGGTTTTTYHRRPMSALWEYIKGKISSVLGLTNTNYGGSAATVNGHTVNSDVPSNAVFTDTSDYDALSNRPSINGTTLSGNKTAAELGLAASSDIPTVPVQSVNGKTGAVVLSASDVGAGTYSKPSGGIPASDLASAVQTSLGKADTALQSVPSTYRTAAAQDTIDSGKQATLVSGQNIKTINEQTILGSGDLTIDIPTSTSELTNDSGYITGITSSDVTNALGYTPPTQDTTYESKAAASGGTAVSLVTTGEKYNWNTRGIPSGGSSGQVLKKSSATNYAVTWSNDSGKALHVSKSSFSSLPQTISNSSITASMRVVNCVWGTPASITGNVTWTTAAGSLTLSGSISGSTTAEIDLIEF